MLLKMIRAKKLIPDLQKIPFLSRRKIRESHVTEVTVLRIRLPIAV